MKKIDNVKVQTKKLTSETALDTLLHRYQGSLLGFGSDEDEVDFDSIDEKQTYRIKSELYDAAMDDRLRRQVDDKVLELEVGLALKREFDEMNTDSAHLHPNYILGNKEFDGIIVHVGNEHQDSDAYIIECGYNPSIDKVASVFDKVNAFTANYKSDPHFSRVKTIIPVFGARHFRPEVSAYCLRERIWQVKPSGFGYQVVRYYSRVKFFLK